MITSYGAIRVGSTTSESAQPSKPSPKLALLSRARPTRPKPPLGLSKSYAATRRYRRRVVKPQLTSDLKLVLITTAFPSPCSPKSASSMGEFPGVYNHVIMYQSGLASGLDSSCFHHVRYSSDSTRCPRDAAPDLPQTTQMRS